MSHMELSKNIERAARRRKAYDAIWNALTGMTLEERLMVLAEAYEATVHKIGPAPVISSVSLTPVKRPIGRSKGSKTKKPVAVKKVARPIKDVAGKILALMAETPRIRPVDMAVKLYGNKGGSAQACINAALHRLYRAGKTMKGPQPGDWSLAPQTASVVDTNGTSQTPEAPPPVTVLDLETHTDAIPF